jgi:hypothetical protein
MWSVTKLVLFGSLFCSSLLFGGSVRIFNDSIYQLTANILAADGSHQGSLSLAPQQQAQWQDFSGDNSTWSQTPYTIVLICKNGKTFGTITGVGQGGTVSVLSARGPLVCEKDKKDEQKNNKGSMSVPSQQQPFNPNQEPFNPNQMPFDATPGQGQSDQQGQEGNSIGPTDPHSAPGDPIWGPP